MMVKNAGKEVNLQGKILNARALPLQGGLLRIRGATNPINDMWSTEFYTWVYPSGIQKKLTSVVASVARLSTCFRRFPSTTRKDEYSDIVASTGVVSGVNEMFAGHIWVEMFFKDGLDFLV